MYSDVIIVIENMEYFYNNNYSDTFVLLGIFFLFWQKYIIIPCYS